MLWLQVLNAVLLVQGRVEVAVMTAVTALLFIRVLWIQGMVEVLLVLGRS